MIKGYLIVREGKTGWWEFVAITRYLTDALDASDIFNVLNPNLAKTLVYETPYPYEFYGEYDALA